MTSGKTTKEPLTMEQRALVSEYLETAKMIAGRRINRHVPPEDRLQDAYMGLMDAARTFDPERGLEFSTHAYRRILGAIVDGERWRGGLIRVGRGQVSPGIVQASAIGCDDGRDVVLFVAPETRASVDDRDDIEVALSILSERDCQIICRYYLDGVPMRLVGIEVGLCETRVSQVIKMALAKLRDHSALSAYARSA